MSSFQHWTFIPLVILFLLSLNGYSQEGGKTSHYSKNDLRTHEIILSEYLRIKSTSGNEKVAGEFLKKICSQMGLSITPMGQDNGNYNFAASLRPLSANLPNIIFLNHIDVVPTRDSTKWVYSPFSGKITDTEIWGRGAFDNKGAAVMQLATLFKLDSLYGDSNLPYNVTFLAVSCEETQCNGGVKYVVENYMDLLNPAVVIGEGPPALKGVLTSEPEVSVFGISVAHKRAFWLKLESTIQTSGHGSITPSKYSNRQMVQALHKLTRKKQRAVYNRLNVGLLKDLGRMEGGIMGFVLRHPRLFRPLIIPQLRKQPELFALFSNTLTLTSIDSWNNVVNIVPAKATALLDCRLLPSASSDRFLNRLSKKISKLSIDIKVLKEMPEMQPSSDSSIFYKNLKDAILEKYPESQVVKMFAPNFSDAGIFRSHGIPAFSSIPVEMDMSYLENIHTYNERIPRRILEEGTEIYVKFVRKCIEADSREQYVRGSTE